MSSSGVKRTLDIEWPGHPTHRRRSPRRLCEVRLRGTTAVSWPLASGRSPAGAVIQASTLVRRLWLAFLTFAGPRSRMTGFTAAEFILSTLSGRSNFPKSVSRHNMSQSSRKATFACYYEVSEAGCGSFRILSPATYSVRNLSVPAAAPSPILIA